MALNSLSKMIYYLWVALKSNSFSYLEHLITNKARSSSALSQIAFNFVAFKNLSSNRCTKNCNRVRLSYKFPAMAYVLKAWISSARVQFIHVRYRIWNISGIDISVPVWCSHMSSSFPQTPLASPKKIVHPLC